MADGWLRDRLRSTWIDRWVVLELGVAAGLAWFLAGMLLGQTNSFFAPAAAVLVVGGSIGRQLRQTVELIAGITVGLVLADGLIHLIGRGPVQLGVVVALSAGLALLVSGGKMLLNQATTTAVLIVALYPSASSGIFYERWLDALIGAGVALVVRAAVVPLLPLALRRATGVLRAQLGEAFDGAHAGLRAADQPITRDAAARLESAQTVLRDVAEETGKLAKVISVALVHRRTRRILASAEAKLPFLGAALTHTHLALRAEADELVAGVPDDLVDAVSALARGTDELVASLLRPEDRPAARPAAPSHERLAGVSPQVADHVRSASGELARAAAPAG
ncbi:Fusaric acid resistance protein-like [Asanoa hainanensis]|uniref:Fusaric acid resistance protein-like n=1 Tax=Asanoa hainanensis TaxID=560556 RepID=A0A239K166_9ACTN|nr:FUSC family protein [Asanoa hainanensis]SNT11423.1 Fusaric acid resistance protein-like [Asanoa hainanensis]